MGKIELTREELYERVWTTPATKLAAELGISDVGLGKICKRMRIPKPPLGYWRRIETGHSVPRSALPKAQPGDPRVAFLSGKRPEDEKRTRFEPANPEITALIRAERAEDQHILVADVLQDALPIIRQTERAYHKAKPGQYGYLVASATTNHLDLRISREALDRVLRILDTLLKALQQRKLANKAGEIRKYGEQITVGMTEKFTRSDNPDYEEPKGFLWNRRPRWIYTPTGRLTLYLEAAPAGRRELHDKVDCPLEQQLNDAIVKMLVLSEENKVERQAREAAQRRQEEAERQRQIEERRRREELARQQALEQQAANWARAEAVRAFVHACEQRLIAQLGILDAASPEAAWIAWAYAHADRLDPTMGEYRPTAIRDLACKDQLRPWEDEQTFDQWRAR